MRKICEHITCRNILLLSLVFFFILQVMPSISQEKKQAAPADDLTPEIRSFLQASGNRQYHWTLIGENVNYQAHEDRHPRLNVLRRLWHMPLPGGRSAFKFEFTRPYMQGANVLHLYLKTDGDNTRGRLTEGTHKGVDYMLTFLEGNPNHSGNSLGAYSAGGESSRKPVSLILIKNVLYMAADISIEQKEGSSVFEYFVTSYTKEPIEKGYKVVASSNMGYNKAISEGVPAESDKEETSLLINPEMLTVNGGIPGWHISARKESGTSAERDESEGGALVVKNLYHLDNISQAVTLEPGNYLLRALVKTNTFQAHLHAINNNFILPIGVSDKHNWVELPFHVAGKEKKFFDVGIVYVGYPPTRHPATVSIKRMELLRTGDTVLPERWVETAPVHPLHLMELINKDPNWNRPGKVIFRDSLIGTEIWMMTQGGKVDHSYVGTPDFSYEGKYIYTGFMNPPRGLLRTDGTRRFINNSFKGLVWLFPWELKRLPAGSDPSDWICLNRSLSTISLMNVVTGEKIQIDMPSRPGWKIIENPNMPSSRGPNISNITHDTIVWHSDDRKLIGLSDTRGENFREYNIKSISAKPEEDVVYPSGPNGQNAAPMSSVWGKGWNNWRNAVDRDGNRYYLFEINRGKFFDDPMNPYQVWALSLTPGDRRGLLRVIPNPRVTITEHVTTHSGGIPQPSYNWWELAAGLPRSGDNAVLKLEDGTLLHMSSLGMHSHFINTLSVNDPYTGEVTFIGNNTRVDRISWPHEFRRDKDYAALEGYAEPTCPVLILDLENKTYWTAVFTNFHDYAIRYRTRLDKTAYHKPMFRTSPTPSPDFTKFVFFSSMLTGEHPDRLWADLYVGVMRYPQPPSNVRIENNYITWDKPGYHREIEGFNIYRSKESGRKFEKVNVSPVKETKWSLSSPDENFYVLTSVEYSGLESRMFSNEVSAGKSKTFRHFYQAETGALKSPMVPFFEPATAGNAYGVAITDPELVYARKLKEGLSGSLRIPITLPARGPVRIMARVRGMCAMERETHTTGWKNPGPAAEGRFNVKINGKYSGQVPVRGIEWKWIGVDKVIEELPAGKNEIEFSTQDAGIAIDAILLTNDPGFVPQAMDNTPSSPPSKPSGVKIERIEPGKEAFDWQGYKIKPPYARISWEKSESPHGVKYYNIHRETGKDFAPSQTNLLGSTHETFFIDPTEIPGEYNYRVVAVDNWSNTSKPSDTLSITVK